MVTQVPITPITENPPETWEEPDISNIVIEDDTPVDSWFSEKQQRLLTISLYSALPQDEPFVALANVGLFYAEKHPPLVPDVMVSFGVKVPEDWTLKKNRSYFTWNMGKTPDIALEIVSNKVGNELGSKLEDYARARVGYYVVFDPLQCLGDNLLYVYQLQGTQYHLQDDYLLEQFGLELILWPGSFEGQELNWLRWRDRQGNLLLTGDERAEQEHQRAEQEHQRAEQEHQRAEQEHQRAEQEHQRAEQERQRAEQERQRAEFFAQLLREQGIDPDQ